MDDGLVPAHLRHRLRTSRSSGCSRWRSGSALGAAIGALQGFIIAYIGVPSFIVTLGGLLSIRGLVWYQSQGAAVDRPRSHVPAHRRRRRRARVGGTVTWVLGILGCVAIIGLLDQQPSAAAALRLPGPADVGRGPARGRRLCRCPRARLVRQQQLLAAGPGRPIRDRAELGTDARRRPGDPGRLPVPDRPAHRRHAGHDASSRPGGASAATCTPTAATPRRPSSPASTRAGRSSRPTSSWASCARSPRPSPPRASTASTLDIGQSYELYVIAAAVVGGTSFAGGIGTIPGAVLGAFVMQSLAYGLSFIGRQLARPERRGRHRADRRRRLRHAEPPARLLSGKEDRAVTVAERTPLVEMRDINVAFGGVHAVRDVTIDLYAGEVIGLVGGNGAGKSTLMRVLSGAHPADTRRDPDRRPDRSRSATRATPRRSTSRRSTRRSPWPTTSTRRATCSWAARRRPGSGSLDDSEHGVRDAQDHGSPEPELQELRASR